VVNGERVDWTPPVHLTVCAPRPEASALAPGWQATHHRAEQGEEPRHRHPDAHLSRRVAAGEDVGRKEQGYGAGRDRACCDVGGHARLVRVAGAAVWSEPGWVVSARPSPWSGVAGQHESYPG